MKKRLVVWGLCPGLPARKVIISCLALLAIVLAGLVFWLASGGGPNLGSLPMLGGGPGKRVTFLSQLEADSRSVIAALQYLCESEPAQGLPITNRNGMVTNLSVPAFAMPTNSTTADPKA